MKNAFIIGLVLGLGGSFVGFKFWKYANSSTNARSKDMDMRQVLGRAVRNPTSAPTGQTKYRGQYIKFEYPARAKVYPLKKASEVILEVIDLEIDIPRLTIVATVMATGEKTLEEVPGVRIRKDQIKIYKEQWVNIGGLESLVFTKIDGKEKTGFFLKGKYLYTLSITGNDDRSVNRLWEEILPTLEFL